MSIIDRLMNRAPRFERNELNEIDVRFHKEANHHTIHGYLIVTHRQLGVREGAVAFSFPNFSDAPDLDLRLMLDLFEAAKSQGFIPHRLAAYGALQPMPEAQGASPAAPAAAPTLWTPENSTFERRLQSVPAVVRKQAITKASERPQSSLKFLTDLHAMWAPRVQELSEQDREALEIAIDQIMSNGRALKYDNETLMLKVQEAYEKAVPDTIPGTEEAAAALKLQFRRTNGAAPNAGEASSH
ncbi:hypothetical protein AWB81_04224 [Caballeronia arationis]|uniref:hypothetical protein n=1 Tax=Caballeronia arationis TaxID=1777142 RepID=UPI00074CA3F8|nr:hypothetical protein [Caballeronia arationis]SAK83614.1 hypothetical protein AWB81_04224 [Caballeronia arationis]